MKNNVNLKFGICGIICSFVLTFFTIHAYAQNPQGLDLLSAPTNTKFNTTTEIVSLVPNVTITKFEILSPGSLGLDVKYSGPGKSPAVKVNISAININSTFEQIANQIGMNNDSSNNSTIFNASGSTTSIVTQLEQLGNILTESNGTKSLKAGWESPSTFTVKLKGNTTLNDAQFIAVTVRDNP